MRFKLRTKITFLFTGIAVIPLLAVSLAVIARLENLQTQNALEMSKKTADNAALEIAHFLQSQFNILRHAELFYPEWSEDAAIRQVLLERILFTNESFTEIAVTDEAGMERLRVHRYFLVAGPDLLDRSVSPEFKAVKTDGIYISPLFFELSRPVFLIGKAIVDARGNLNGAILARVDARVMQEVVTRISEAGKDGRAYVVDSTGKIIAHPDVYNVLAGKNFTHIPIVRKVSNADPSYVAEIYLNDIGRNVLGSMSNVEISLEDKRSPVAFSTDWFVIAEQDAETALSAVRALIVFSVGVLSLICILAVFAGLLLSYKIVNPIKQVHEAVLRFSEGKLNWRINVSTKDEIEDLARGFNKMAEQLSASIRNLEDDSRVISSERNKLSTVLAGITDGVIALDFEGRVAIFNMAASMILDVSPQYVLERDIRDVVKVFDGDDDNEIDIMRFCSGDLKSEKSILAPIFSKKGLRIISYSGKIIFVDIVIGRIKEGNVADVFSVLTLHDITREREIEQMQRDFVGIAAHQLRTPLSGLKWGLSMLKDGAYGANNNEQKYALEDLYKNIERMIRLVNELLDASLIEGGYEGGERVEVELKDVLKEAFETGKTSSGSKNVKMELQIRANTLPAFSVNRERFKTAVLNVVENAIVYTLPGGKVTIVLDRIGNEARISVSDSGIGIPRREHHRVFTRFFRAYNAAREYTSGSGLGLFVAKKIVEGHNGRIWFSSEEGEGSVFYISLPIESLPQRKIAAVNFKSPGQF